MKNLTLLILLGLLAACGKPTYGDKLVDAGRKWNQGYSMMVDGTAMVKRGQAMVKQGDAMMKSVQKQWPKKK